MGQSPDLHMGQAGVGHCLGLQVDVGEPVGPVQREFGTIQQLDGVVDLAPHRRHRDPPLLDAWRLVSDEPGGSSEPRSAGGLVPQHDGVDITEAGARHGGLALVTGSGEAPDRRPEVRDGTGEVAY